MRGGEYNKYFAVSSPQRASSVAHEAGLDLYGGNAIHREDDDIAALVLGMMS